MTDSFERASDLYTNESDLLRDPTSFSRVSPIQRRLQGGAALAVGGTLAAFTGQRFLGGVPVWWEILLFPPLAFGLLAYAALQLGLEHHLTIDRKRKLVVTNYRVFGQPQRFERSFQQAECVQVVPKIRQVVVGRKLVFGVILKGADFAIDLGHESDPETAFQDASEVARFLGLPALPLEEVAPQPSGNQSPRSA